MSICEEYVRIMAAIPDTEDAIEVELCHARNRDLIANATDAELEQLAGQIMKVRGLTKETCYKELLEWRERLRMTIN